MATPTTSVRVRLGTLAAAVLAMAMLAGCGIHVTKDQQGKEKKVDIDSVLGGVHVSKDEHGNDKKVDIESPFGGVHVRTDVDPKDTGIPVYPGARLKPETEHNQSSANVNISSEFFGVKVVAVAFESDDPPSKVLDFYRDKLKSYGNVLECKGSHGHTTAKPGESKELTCGDETSNMVHNAVHDAVHNAVQNATGGGRAGMDSQNMDSQGMELKVGTTDHAHVVEVKPRGDGSTFSLIYVQTRGGKDSI